jgi:ABC-type amino acid transport substrate-binding protein
MKSQSRRFGRRFDLFVAILAAAIGGACASPTPAPGPAASVVSEVLAGAATGPAVGTDFARAQETGRAEITYFYVPSSGFAYTDAEGRLTGVTVELLRDFAAFVADHYGIRVRISWVEEPRWADFYGYVRGSSGGVFGIGNVTITEARRSELSFSPPYLNNVAVLVTHQRVPQLSAMEDIPEAFRDLTALSYPGTLHETRLRAIGERWLPGMQTRTVTSNDELVDLLASGGDYFGYIDVYNYWRARHAGLPLRRHPVGDDSSETFGVIMPHASGWAAVMEEFFRANGGYVESEHYRELLRTHLGEELAGLLAG